MRPLVFHYYMGSGVAIFFNYSIILILVLAWVSPRRSSQRGGALLLGRGLLPSYVARV